MIGKLLLTFTIVDSQELDQNEKPIIYAWAFVEIYNQCSRRLVYETHGMVNLEKYLISKAENYLSLGDQQFYIIFEIVQSVHVVLKDIEDNILYLNNYIDCD